MTQQARYSRPKTLRILFVTSYKVLPVFRLFASIEAMECPKLSDPRKAIGRFFGAPVTSLKTSRSTTKLAGGSRVSRTLLLLP